MSNVPAFRDCRSDRHDVEDLLYEEAELLDD